MESLQVSDYMNTHPVKLGVEMPVAEAVEKLLQSGQTGGPVVDAKGKVVGFVSEQDCLQRMIESSYYREQVCRVKEVMTSPALTVKPYSSVLELAQMLLLSKPRIYPVVDDDSVLVGTINRAAVLRAIDLQLRSGYQKMVS
ncbi:CBS domain-containing protein [Alteromonas sp. ASW11-130]|uniref:CBS domain-containing protein n=1 Tax=Alteromonas sp. ASW11-130 TaxID=3015775 RepID=UPI00224264B2|nr:CBS domain-containing protein [Alteromonas sp. ASW11-130]MCW8091980.1 CBS domain-containing protein [Alteromonas sp. ASW11-130]